MNEELKHPFTPGRMVVTWLELSCTQLKDQ